MQKPKTEGATRGNIKNYETIKGMDRGSQSGQRPIKPPAGTGNHKKK
mgnify:CR=1 FL=1